MAKKKANRSNKRAARREMPSPPPEPAIHDGAENSSTHSKFKQDPSGHKKRKSKLPSALDISKKQKNKIFKAESRHEALMHKISLKTVKQSVRAQRRVATETETDLASLSKQRAVVDQKEKDKLKGADLLKLVRKVKVGGMDVDSGSDSDNNEWEDEPRGVDEEMKDTDDSADRNRAIQAHVPVQDIEVPF
ncbi:hypothetical protein LIPSTDRAFT_112548 [Lipomyces starkeyi NRRL Y-11557]|uniref:Uncharacterized protein n=1 Tax=Lipomyces starkeyi NRRL Y-11557 TaxID=675824 RepID=A0A1E3Q2N0_LIPST|nr:hypothetical protein LIPSTDRAFT_112548 [Lipomyces starkeyi NRRL Y-11557]